MKRSTVLLWVALGCHSTLDANEATAPVVAPLTVPDASSTIDDATAPTVPDAAAANDSGPPVRPLAGHCAKMAADYLALPPAHGTCDKTACAAAGGGCAYAGFCFGEACVRRSKTAGATCTDSRQCDGGGCFAPDGTRPGPGTGKCAATVLDMGCHVYVSGGIVSRGALCAD